MYLQSVICNSCWPKIVRKYPANLQELQNDNIGAIPDAPETSQNPLL